MSDPTEDYMKEDKEQTLSATTLGIDSSVIAGGGEYGPEDNVDSDSLCSFSSSSGAAKLRLCDESRPSTPSDKSKKRRRKEVPAVLLEAGQEMNAFTDLSTNVTYRVGDTVYVQHKKGDAPSSVCTVLGFQGISKGQLHVTVKHYYRATEVPDSVYLPLVNDRNAESKPGVTQAIKDPIVRTRELFRSEVTESFPVALLRGKCRVVHYEDIHQVEHFKLLPDLFFYIFEYSPTTKRLATILGEIRVGPSHQARLPEYQPNVRTCEMAERCESWEVLTWKPTAVLDGDLVMYLRAARSMAAFAGMCDGGSTEDAFTAASMDETTIKALNMLHNSDYDTKKALSELVKRINPKSYERRWSDEDVKKFVKGLRSYGKNFFKIRKELLPNKDTGELVEYYYYWKKTPAAHSSRPHTRRRRQRKQAHTPTRQTSTDDLDASSASDGSEDESELSDSCSSRDLTGYYCRNCYTTKSKDWHHRGKGGQQLLCTECRTYYEKHAADRPQFLFKPVKEKTESDSQDSELDQAARESPSSRSVSSLSSQERTANAPSGLPVTTSAKPSGGGGGAKSEVTTGGSSAKSSQRVGTAAANSTTEASEEPGAASTGTAVSTEVQTKRKEAPTKGEEDPVAKRAKPTDGFSQVSESGVSEGSCDNDENGNEGDVETNQEDATSSESSSPTDDVNKKNTYLNGIPRPIPKPAQAPVVQTDPTQPQEGPPEIAREPVNTERLLERETLKKEERTPVKVEGGTPGDTRTLVPHGHSFQPVASFMGHSNQGTGAPLNQPIKTDPVSEIMQTGSSAMFPSAVIKTEPKDVKQPTRDGSGERYIDQQQRVPTSQDPHKNYQQRMQRQSPTRDQQRVQRQSPSRDQQRVQRQSPTRDAAPLDLQMQRQPISAQERRDIHDNFVGGGSRSGAPIPISLPNKDQREDQRDADKRRGTESEAGGNRESSRDPREMEREAYMRELQAREMQAYSQLMQGRDPRDLSPFLLRGDPRDPRSLLLDPRDPRLMADPRIPISMAGVMLRESSAHPFQMHHPSARDSFMSSREAQSPKAVTARESPRLRESPSPRNRELHAREGQSPQREHAHLSRDKGHPLQSPSTPSGAQRIPGNMGPPTSVVPDSPVGAFSHAHSTQSKLPQPPPLVSLPQTTTPTTYPPSLVSSTRNHPSAATGMLPPGHPYSQQQLYLARRSEVNRRPEERSRSRSPPSASSRRSPTAADAGSDSDSEPPRSPEPEATVVIEECYRSKNAIFIKHLSRGWNSCSRCDLQFRLRPDSDYARRRADPSGSSTAARKSSASAAASGGNTRREERRDGERDRSGERPGSTLPKKDSDLHGADAHITSSLLHSPHHLYPGPPGGRMSPRPPHPLSAGSAHLERTPALNTLSRYAMHNVGVHEAAIRAEILARSQAAAVNCSPYGPGGPLGPLGPPPPHPQHALMSDPYRLAMMYPNNSRERLELELEWEKRERDARERDMRERELRDLEMREKMKHDLEMKPPGFERPFPPGISPLDPFYSDLLKKFPGLAHHPPGAPPTPVPLSMGPPGGPHPGHLLYSSPGMQELLARERDRLERLGLPTAHMADPAFAERLAAEHRLHAERLQAALAADPLLRLPPHSAPSGPPGTRPPPPGGQPGPPPHGLPSHLHLPPHQASDLHEAHLALAAHGAGHPLLEAARQSELRLNMYRDMLSRPQYSSDPMLAQQLSAAHQEQLYVHRQLLIELERMRDEIERIGLPPHLP